MEPDFIFSCPELTRRWRSVRRSQRKKIMNKIAISRGALLLLSTVAVVPPPAVGQPADSDTLAWMDDYKQALALAQRTGRPLLVEFRCAP